MDSLLVSNIIILPFFDRYNFSNQQSLLQFLYNGIPHYYLKDKPNSKPQNII